MLYRVSSWTRNKTVIVPTYSLLIVLLTESKTESLMHHFLSIILLYSVAFYLPLRFYSTVCLDRCAGKAQTKKWHYLSRNGIGIMPWNSIQLSKRSTTGARFYHKKWHNSWQVKSTTSSKVLVCNVQFLQYLITSCIILAPKKEQIFTWVLYCTCAFTGYFR